MLIIIASIKKTVPINLRICNSRPPRLPSALSLAARPTEQHISQHCTENENQHNANAQHDHRERFLVVREPRIAATVAIAVLQRALVERQTVERRYNQLLGDIVHDAECVRYERPNVHGDRLRVAVVCVATHCVASAVVAIGRRLRQQRLEVLVRIVKPQQHRLQRGSRSNGHIDGAVHVVVNAQRPIARGDFHHFDDVRRKFVVLTVQRDLLDGHWRRRRRCRRQTRRIRDGSVCFRDLLAGHWRRRRRCRRQTRRICRGSRGFRCGYGARPVNTFRLGAVQCDQRIGDMAQVGVHDEIPPVCFDGSIQVAQITVAMPWIALNVNVQTVAGQYAIEQAGGDGLNAIVVQNQTLQTEEVIKRMRSYDFNPTAGQIKHNQTIDTAEISRVYGFSEEIVVDLNLEQVILGNSAAEEIRQLQ